MPESEVGRQRAQERETGAPVEGLPPLHSIRLPSARCEVTPSLAELWGAASSISGPISWSDAPELVSVWLRPHFQSK